MNDCTPKVRASPTTSQGTKAAFLLSLPDKFPPSQTQWLLQWKRGHWIHFRQATKEEIRNRRVMSQRLPGRPGTAECCEGHTYCFVRTQLFGARQQVLLVREDVVEDEELGGDGVALSPSSCSAALPLLTENKGMKQNKKVTVQAWTQAIKSVCIICE